MWLRAQETPVQLPVSVLACIVSIITVATSASSLPALALAFYGVLGVGGALAATGRVVDDLNLEAAGLAAMIAALWFITGAQLGHAQSEREIVSAVLNSGAFVIGFSIRLYVLRTAISTRRKTARALAKRVNRDG